METKTEWEPDIAKANVRIGHLANALAEQAATIGGLRSLLSWAYGLAEHNCSHVAPFCRCDDVTEALARTPSDLTKEHEAREAVVGKSMVLRSMIKQYASPRTQEDGAIAKQLAEYDEAIARLAALRGGGK